VETSTENATVCRDFSMHDPSRAEGGRPFLCIIDGGKGIYKGLKDALGEQA